MILNTLTTYYVQYILYLLGQENRCIMKKICLFIFSLVCIAGCEHQDSIAENQNSDINVKAKTGKVNICHKGKIINVNGNALNAHQKHGDAVDMDGDGLFDIENVCSATDCDDNDTADCDNEGSAAELLVGTWGTSHITIDASVGSQSVLDYLINVVGLSPEDAAAKYELLQASFAAELTGILTINADNTYNSNFNGGFDSGTWSLSAEETTLTLFEGADIIIIIINDISEAIWNATTSDDFLVDLDNDPSTPEELVSVSGNVIFTK